MGPEIDGESSYDISGSAVALSANGHVLASGVYWNPYDLDHSDKH